MSGMWIAIIVVAVIVIWVIAIYNALVRLRENRENAFADIDVQLKLRHDLVPQLVNSVKGYMEHEAGTLKAITEARQAAVSASSVDRKSTRLNSSHVRISYAVFCLKKKKIHVK